MKVVVPVSARGPRDPPLWDLEPPIPAVLSWDPGCPGGVGDLSGIRLGSSELPCAPRGPYPISGEGPSPVGVAVLNIGVWKVLHSQKAAFLMHETPSGAICTLR